MPAAMDHAARPMNQFSSLFGALLMFGALTVLTRASAAAEMSFWPIVTLLIAAFLYVVWRSKARVPLMSRSALLKTLAAFALLWTSFAIRQDRVLHVERTVHGILAEVPADKAYDLWTAADLDSQLAMESADPDLAKRFEARRERDRLDAEPERQTRQRAQAAAKEAERQRRAEAWAKNPLRYPVEFVELVIVLLGLNGNPGH